MYIIIHTVENNKFLLENNPCVADIWQFTSNWLPKLRSLKSVALKSNFGLNYLI